MICPQCKSLQAVISIHAGRCISLFFSALLETILIANENSFNLGKSHCIVSNFATIQHGIIS